MSLEEYMEFKYYEDIFDIYKYIKGLSDHYKICNMTMDYKDIINFYDFMVEHSEFIESSDEEDSENNI